MNFGEGTRRLALFVGFLGAIAGGFGSYLELKPTLKQKADHNRFERLADSDVVQKERKCRLLGYESGCSQITPKKSEDPYAATAEPTQAIGAKVEQEDDLADIANPFPSELNKNEIKTINWGEGKEYLVESIETEDGNTLHPTSLPSRWVYLLAVILPLAGFLLPWGLIRSVQWVAAGFLVNQESN